MLAGMAQPLTEQTTTREGYELWRPNREKSEAKVTKALVGLVLLISAALLLIITIGGWERLQSPSVAVMAIAWALLYILFAFLVVARWQRGVLPVASALAIILAIFAMIAAPAWFARDKVGLDSPAMPEDLLGLLTFLVVPVQLALIAIAMIAFNQNWHVEEERPIGGGPDPDYDETPPDDRPEPAPA
jgi:presenilin-like A22 family membrane protease